MKRNLMEGTIDIETVYDAMSGRLYNISLRITGCGTDAEEIMHDTLIQWWRHGSKDEIKDLSKWLSSVCIRKSIDRIREKHRWRDFLEHYQDPMMGESDDSGTEYEIERVHKALLKLPDHYRTIVSLHLFEGYDYQEIAQITGTNENTIRSLYMRGRQKLAAAVREKKS